jgi:hypothetical protein
MLCHGLPRTQAHHDGIVDDEAGGDGHTNDGSGDFSLASNQDQVGAEKPTVSRGSRVPEMT